MRSAGMEQQQARWLIIAGLILFVAGLVWYFWGDRLHWIGRLPGDIRVERENFRFYFPLTTMILVSLLASAILALIKKFL